MYLGGQRDYRYIDDLGVEDSWITLASLMTRRITRPEANHEP
jgi:hypothetical protein